MINLFRYGKFTLRSGAISPFKIDCEALVDRDWKALARVLRDYIGEFSRAIGIPSGGIPLAKALNEIASAAGPILIVDDVLTTGTSMEDMRLDVLNDWPEQEIRGAVVFARGAVPEWVFALFTLAD